MCPCEWEISRVVVKNDIGVTSGMASQTGIAVVNVSPYANVLVVGFRVGMAGDAGEFGIIGWVRMAIGASAPLPVVFPTVNGEILDIMVKCRRCPHRLRVAARAVRGKFERDVVGSGRLGVIAVVATVAGIGRIVVVAVVALGTIVRDGRVRPI